MSMVAGDSRSEPYPLATVVTRSPASASRTAATRPAIPAPRTMTSTGDVWSCSLTSRVRSLSPAGLLLAVLLLAALLLAALLLAVLLLAALLLAALLLAALLL